MSELNCNTCNLFKNKFSHKCLDHATCQENNLWNPSVCTDCKMLFELAEVTSQPNEASVILCQLARKFQSIARVEGNVSGKMIFVSDSIANIYAKNWFKNTIFLKKR